MKHASLFSGIGACELAATWMGWENVFHCEINPFGQQVLNYYWPESISYHDIKKTDFRTHRGTVDVLSGGFPCQPFSTAGKRKGTEDDRNLWPEMLRAVQEIRPHWVVAENVRGLTNWNGGLVFDQVQSDLETAGYEVLPFLLPACGVGAPHRRDRIWFVSHKSKQGLERGIGWSSERKGFAVYGGPTPNSNEHGFNSGNSEHEIQPSERGFNALNDFEQVVTADAERLGQSRQGRPEGQSRAEAFRDWKASWLDPDGRWPTQPPVCGRNDGISAGLVGITVPKHRKESLMAYGNSMVPQVVYQIFKAISQIESRS